METILQSLPLASIPKATHSSSSASSSAIFFHCNALSVASASATTRNFPKGSLSACPPKAKDKSSLVGAICASQSQAETPPAQAAQRWLLVPIGLLFLLLNLDTCIRKSIDKSLILDDDIYVAVLRFSALCTCTPCD